MCGYHNPIRTVVLNSLEGTETLHIHESTYFKLPFSEGQIITDGNGNYMRVTGWQKSGDPSAHVSAPGVLYFVEEDISLDAVGDKVYGISFAETQGGSISTEQTVGDLTGAAAGETVLLYVNPDPGYGVGKVSYQVCAGDNPLLDPVTLQPVEVEIPLTDGEYRFVMPDVSAIDTLANTLLINAEFEGISAHTISCAPGTNGTIGIDDETGACEGETVRVRVEANKGYEVSGVYVNGTEIEPSENGDYFFTMPTEDVTLTAEFTPVTYVITYELNGGEIGDVNPETYTVESETITLADPTREGFDFLGWYDDEFFKKDVITEIAQGSTGDLTLYAKWKEWEYVSDWTLLQNEIDAAAEDAVITLTQDYLAESNDVALTVTDGKKLTVDLNGHTLDANGNAIRIFEIRNGDLTIEDSSGADGKITGGNVGNSVGGAIIVRAGGTLTLNGGQITDCAASNGGAVALTAASSLFTMNGGAISGNSAAHGGGVHAQQGTFVMNGGAIKNNSAAENGGGLYATQNADITLAGGRIERNTAEKGNVYLNSVGMKVSGDPFIESVYLTDPIISVIGELADTALIGLTYSNNDANNGKTLTSGLNGNGAQENFVSAKNGYLIGGNPDGEIVMGTPVTVSFDAGGGSETEAQTIAKNSVAAEPAAPTCAGCVFTGWYLNGEAYDFGMPVTEDLTLIAAFDLDETAVDEVIGKINAIGTVEYTEGSRAKIDAARNAYNALTDAQKALVANYAALTAAEARYAELKAQAEQEAADQAAADAVINKIGAIGAVEYTEESRAKIDAAREAYNALTDEQKALVANYATLTAAEARYAELKAAAEAPTDPTEPTDPAEPDTPSGDSACKWCGETHIGFWGAIVRFFNSILYFFAHLFGRR